MSSSNVSGATNFFPTANEGFMTTLSTTISSGANTVPLQSVVGLTNNTIFVGIIEPGLANQQTFTGMVNTSALEITGVVWTRGTNVGHVAGVAIVDYVSGTDLNLVTTGILKQHSQAGAHVGLTNTGGATFTGGLTTDSLTISGGSPTAGWTLLGQAVASVTYNGNRSYSLSFTAVNLTTTLTPGMRLLMPRTVVAPIQCTSLNGSTQFYSKTSPAGMTFTNNFVCSAWVKATAYPASAASIVSRYNGTSGWKFDINASGQIRLIGFNGSASNNLVLSSNISIPLNKWVHVVAQMDMTSTTNSPTVNYVMFDSVDVPATLLRGGTNPTSLIQAGNLEIGSDNGGSDPWNGKLAQLAVYGAKVTQATIAASSAQTLVGTETSLISAYTFNNSINDLNANANNLTANGSAAATNTDTPFTQTQASITAGTLNYGIATSVTFSTNTTVTVQVPEGDTLPTSGGIGAMSYSINKVPFGFPVQRGKWDIESLLIAVQTQTSPVNGTFYNLGSYQISAPIGAWNLVGELQAQASGSSTISAVWAFSTANNSQTETRTAKTIVDSSGASFPGLGIYTSEPIAPTVQTPYYMVVKPTQTSMLGLDLSDDGGVSILRLENSYL